MIRLFRKEERMFRILLAGVVLVLGHSGSGGQAVDEQAENRQPGDLVREQPYRGWSERRSLRGKVVQCSRQSITLRLPEDKEVTIKIHPDLARLEFPPDFFISCYKYAPTDVEPGDLVQIIYLDDGRLWQCDEITILRRPGGKVPKGHSPGPYLLSHHDWMNALQAWEEKGTPIHDWYHPGGNQAGIAPMPRAAGEPMPHEFRRIPHVD